MSAEKKTSWRVQKFYQFYCLLRNIASFIRHVGHPTDVPMRGGHNTPTENYKKLQKLKRKSLEPRSLVRGRPSHVGTRKKVSFLAEVGFNH